MNKRHLIAATAAVAATAPGSEIGSVSVRGSTVYYTEGIQEQGVALLKSIPTGGGAPTVLADLGAYEASANPDAGSTYGFVDLPSDCAAQLPGPASYSGVVDVHPYASTATAAGVYVADAAGNAIVKVAPNGAVSTVAVLPPTAPVVVTAEAAAANGFPACTVGSRYSFEPVPTDVEVGPGGQLYVTSLPGGPEDASLGARGSVLKVDPTTGAVRTVATGLISATGLAVDRVTGTIALTELFGGAQGTGRVALILPRTSTPITGLDVTSPAAIELKNGALYVARNAFVISPEGAPQPIGTLTVAKLTGAGARMTAAD
ncbi:ScyD/ScyE family protein [Rathayibacter sp. SD072]|uniref:ScyD/ScyE family protein n=1 Tax=Rathayibacter sp. SD072 TaxID=2781731 RepID=UPI001A962AA9|nr:ScyD/ScyE family protein [Rathayibacter sp. SD072]MBO0984558.1 ScyD/ScyE family protein [Rathayibacter sp. SD072]